MTVTSSVPSAAVRPVSSVADAPFHRAAAATRPGGQVAIESESTESMLLPADLLGGDESIILAIKPSLWFVVFDSANLGILALFVIVCASWFAELVRISETQLMSAALAVVAVRIGLAFLRWVSQFYVLTNRRVMRMRGVFQPDVFECPLLNVRNTAVTTAFPEAMTGLGTIHFILTDADRKPDCWSNVSQPDQVHAEVRKAIERAIDSQPRI